MPSTIKGLKGQATRARKGASQDQVAAKAPRAHGGKPGSNRSNQTAKYSKGELPAGKPAMPKPKPGTISEVKPATTGGPKNDSPIIVATGKPGQPGFKALQIPRSRMVGELAKLAVVGGALKAVEQYLAANKPQAKLATGVTGHTAPQSALAAAQSRGKPEAKPVAKAAAKTASKARKPATAKGADRAYKVLAKKHDRRPGTWTDYMLATALANTSTAKADAACAASEYGKAGKRIDWRWIEAKGYIAF